MEKWSSSVDSSVIEDLSNNVFSVDVSDESMLLLKKTRWKEGTPDSIKQSLSVPLWEYSELNSIKDIPEYETICDYCIRNWYDEMLVKENIILDNKNKKLIVSKSVFVNDLKFGELGTNQSILANFN